MNTTGMMGVHIDSCAASPPRFNPQQAHLGTAAADHSLAVAGTLERCSPCRPHLQVRTYMAKTYVSHHNLRRESMFIRWPDLEDCTQKDIMAWQQPLHTASTVGDTCTTLGRQDTSKILCKRRRNAVTSQQVSSGGAFTWVALGRIHDGRRFTGWLF